MDTIWDRKSFEVGSLAVVAGMKKTNDHAEPTKVERLKKQTKTSTCFLNNSPQ